MLVKRYASVFPVAQWDTETTAGRLEALARYELRFDGIRVLGGNSPSQRFLSSG